MKSISIDALHVFIIFMISSFIILSVLAITGKFDHWTSRLKKLKFKRKNRIYPDKKR